jgi:predicted phage-related endonuclease
MNDQTSSLKTSQPKVSLKQMTRFEDFKAVNLDAEKKSVEKERAEIEQDMLNMAKSMKEYSNNIKEQLHRDQQIIEKVN